MRGSQYLLYRVYYPTVSRIFLYRCKWILPSSGRRHEKRLTQRCHHHLGTELRGSIKIDLIWQIIGTVRTTSHQTPFFGENWSNFQRTRQSYPAFSDPSSMDLLHSKLIIKSKLLTNSQSEPSTKETGRTRAGNSISGSPQGLQKLTTDTDMDLLVTACWDIDYGHMQFNGGIRGGWW